jgi:stage II sporulation protein AA (anti-sigma F factor antagonist)
MKVRSRKIFPYDELEVKVRILGGKILNISTFVKQGVLIARIDGELDVHVADQIRQKLDEAIDDGGVKHLLLNLKGVTFIDSSGLGVILGRYKKISAYGGKVTAVNIRPQVARIFEHSGIMKIIKVCTSETEGLQNF